MAGEHVTGVRLFFAATSFALRDVRIDRLGPVHDGRCGDVRAVLLATVSEIALIAWVAAGVLFHTSIAIVMGLQSFVGSLLAAYPLLWAIAVCPWP